MKLLTAIDNTVIVARHVVTVKHGLDHEAYESASLRHFKAEKDIKRTEDDPELQSALKEAMVEMFPNGQPRMKDFYRTRVGLSDGSTHWVKESMEDVVMAVLEVS